MAGSIWDRPDGRKGVSLPYKYRDPETGRILIRRFATTRNTREEAEDWLVEKRREVGDGKAPEDRGVLFSDHTRAWLRDAVEPRVAPRTLEKRVWALSIHLLPEFGVLPLAEVTPRAIQRLYARLVREGYALDTRRQIHVTLRMTLEQAVRWGLIRHNPCALVDPPKQGAREYKEDEEIRALSDGQAARLFGIATDSRWCNYYVAAVRTGLRPGEMLGLRWGDLDLDADPASVRVRRTLDTHRAPRFGPPKSAASRRTVALHFEAADAFVSQRRMLAEEGLPSGPKSLVFPSTQGTPMQSGNLRRRHLQPDLERAGLPRLTLHELRHTFASIMLHEWHVPPAIVQQALGHASIKMTMDTYGHLVEGAQAAEMRRINALYRNQNGQKDA